MRTRKNYKHLEKPVQHDDHEILTAMKKELENYDKIHVC